jgi:hypothetical protein
LSAIGPGDGYWDWYWREPLLVSRKRVVAPSAMLADVAGVVHAGLLRRMGEALSAAYPIDAEWSRERIAGFLEDGMALLTSNRINLLGEPGLSMERIEACRLLAETDRRFRFIYRLPGSVGWGTAIGATIEASVHGESHDEVRSVTGLMNAFMTLVDGMLDEAPDIIAPHRDTLLDLVCEGAAGRDVGKRALPNDHPCNYACFLVGRLWIHGVNALDPLAHYRADLANAASRAMIDEYASCESRFDANGIPSRASLYGRTGWPLWTQALASVSHSVWPEDYDYRAFRELIFRIGDFAAFLDDLRDYISDCSAGQWNTVSVEYFSRHSFACASADEIRERLLVALAEEEFTSGVVRMGCELRNKIADSIVASGIQPCPLNDLLSDLTFDYMH